MSPITKLILACITLIITPRVIGVKHCYQCEYFSFDDATPKNNDTCKESELPDAFKVTCADSVGGGVEPMDWQCLKVSGRVEVDEENYDFIRRSCVPGKALETGCKNTRSYQVTEEHFIKRGQQCHCDSDNCNAGGNIIASGIFVMAALLFAFTNLRI